MWHTHGTSHGRHGHQHSLHTPVSCRWQSAQPHPGTRRIPHNLQHWAPEGVQGHQEVTGERLAAMPKEGSEGHAPRRKNVCVCARVHVRAAVKVAMAGGGDVGWAAEDNNETRIKGRSALLTLTLSQSSPVMRCVKFVNPFSLRPSYRLQRSSAER